MIYRLGTFLTRLAHRFMPDPFIFAILLTIFTILLALAMTNCSLSDVLLAWRGKEGWERGFWGFLAFSTQMCLVLITGHALATSKPIHKFLSWIASKPGTTGSGVVLISVVTMIAGLINWGFGLIVGAVLAKEVARLGRQRGLRFHYPLLGTAGYTGLLIWHGGLSGSAPLKAIDLGISLSHTLFTPLNLTLAVLLLFAVPILLYFMVPKRPEDIVEISEEQAKDLPIEGPPQVGTLASRLENSFVLTLVLCLGAGFVLVRGLLRTGYSFIDLYSVPFLFLFLGMALHGRPIRYVQAIANATPGCAGILLQFPFYAGIASILTGTQLQQEITGWFVSHATAASFPLLAWVSASLLNLFIPSGGGQWMVQGPLLLNAAKQLGVDPGKTVLYLAYGDEYTNLLQPFWALALLGVTGLKARDIMGYSTALMLLVGPLYATCVCFL